MSTMGASNPISKQSIVNTHFAASSRYWRDVYTAESVPATIYRERRDLVLRWIDALGTPCDSSALDVGCGAGFFAVALAERGYRVQAVDTVDSMLQQTADVVRQRGLQDLIMVSHGDAHQLQYTGNSFDLVIAIGVTPWLHSLNRGLSELVRVTKPGGHLILTADNRLRLSYWFDPRFFPLIYHLRRKAANFLRRLGWWSHPHAHGYSIKAFDQALTAAGLHTLCGQTIGFGPFTFFERNLFSDDFGVELHTYLHRLQPRLRILGQLGSQYVVLAQKPLNSSL